MFDFLNKKGFDVSVAFMSMHLGFHACKKAFKTRLSTDQILLRIFRLFWNIFSLFSSYFYLLEGSKIFFMSSKYFIWIHHDPSHL
jgi:hypothetical protein